MNRSPAYLFPEFSRMEPIRSTGILPYQHIRELLDGGYVRALVPFAADQIQPASLDLRLSHVANRVRASFLPGATKRVDQKIHDVMLETIDLSSPTVLERDFVYIIPLMETLHLSPSIWAKANPKSTTGRLDIFTRLITDYGEGFDRVASGYNGPLYAEVISRTFRISVQAGCRLNQLRFLKGSPLPSDTVLQQLDEQGGLVYQNNAPVEARISKGLWLSVDLKGIDGSNIVGYQAKRVPDVIDFHRTTFYEPSRFWEPIPRPEGGYIVLYPDDFYILASKERVRIPPEFAAEMMGYEASVGEFRLHYAGFFDPGFGYEYSGAMGTHAVLEVRVHGVPFLMEHGQRVGRLVFERLTATPDVLYGSEIGSAYQQQTLALSKHFRRS